MATGATNAATATHANTAGSASQSVSDGDGNKISDTYMKIPKEYTRIEMGEKLPFGLYHFVLIYSVDNTPYIGGSFSLGLGNTAVYPRVMYSPVISVDNSLLRVAFGFAMLSGYSFSSMEIGIVSGGTLSFDSMPDNLAADCALYYTKLD